MKFPSDWDLQDIVFTALGLAFSVALLGAGFVLLCVGIEILAGNIH